MLRLSATRHVHYLIYAQWVCTACTELSHDDAEENAQVALEFGAAAALMPCIISKDVETQRAGISAFSALAILRIQVIFVWFCLDLLSLTFQLHASLY